MSEGQSTGSDAGANHHSPLRYNVGTNDTERTQWKRLLYPSSTCFWRPWASA